MTVRNTRICSARALFIHVFATIAAILLLVPTSTSANPTSAQDAARAVRSWLRSDSRPLGTGLGRSVKKVQTSYGADGAVLYYVVYLDPSGYVIVSAEDMVEPIVAFSPEDTLDPTPNNPLWLLANNDLTERTQAARSHQAGAQVNGTGVAAKGYEAARAKWKKLLKSVSVAGIPSVSQPRVSPLVSSKWGQTSDCSQACYNYYTPPRASGTPNNYPAGCVATAMAQLMRFWQYPTTGVGNTSYPITVCNVAQNRALRGGDGVGGVYRWSDMALDPDCSTTLAQRQAIGALCADAGISVRSDYCFGVTGVTDLMYVVTALKTTFMFGDAKLAYDSDAPLATDVRNAATNSNLHAGRPVLLGINSASSGHVVVCDGYGYNLGAMYHHLNMGWNGASDAWYNLPTVNTNPSYDSVAGVIYNTFTSGSGEIIAGRVTDPAGTPIAGALVSAGSFTDITDAQGIYALTKVASNTQYEISVFRDGYTFTPKVATTGASTDNTPTVGNLWNVDFTADAGDIIVDPMDFSVAEGSTAEFGVALSAQPPGDVTVTIELAGGDADIGITEGATLTFTTEDWDVMQNVTVAAAQDSDTVDGSATLHCSASGWVGTDVTATESDDDRQILTDVNAVSVGEGSTATFSVKLQAPPASDVVVAVANVAGDADIGVQSGANLTFTTLDWDTYQTVTLAAQPDEDTANGAATIRCSAAAWSARDVTATEEDSGAPPDAEPPTVPTGLSAFAYSQTRIDLSWTASTDNTAVAGYRIYRGGVQVGTSTTTTFSNTNCSANTTYSYRVSAYDGSGNESGQCQAVTVTSCPYIDIIVDEEAATCVGAWMAGTGVHPLSYDGDYKWTMSAAAETAWAKWTPTLPRAGAWAVYAYYREGTNRTTAAPYSVYYNGGSGVKMVDQTYGGGQWIYMMTKPFIAGSSGYVKLSNNTGEASLALVADAVKFTFVHALPGTDNDPPSVPAGLYGSASASVVQLTWSAASDNVAVAGYRVYRDGVQIADIATAGYSDTTCQPDTSYSYAVLAYDTSGNTSAQCSPVNVTVPQAVDIIMDEDQATTTGSWMYSTGYAGTYNNDYYWASTAAVDSYTAKWTPSIPVSGYYQVYVWFREGPNRSQTAPFLISHKDGTQTCYVDQTILENARQWFYVATAPLLAGTAGFVRLGNGTGESGRVVIADAVKFSYAGPLPIPPSAPTDLPAVALSTTSIKWLWNDVQYETGYRVKNLSSGAVSPDLPAGTVEWVETGLQSNSQYSRKVWAFNTHGESSTGSSGQNRYTLAKAGESTDGTGATGNVWCSGASKNVWYGAGKTFTFTNPAGFGTNGTWKATRFEYKWNKADAEAWATPGTSWTTGSITLSPNAGDGYYYLHVRALNGNSVPNNALALDYGPFMFDSAPPTAVTVTDEGAWTPSATSLAASWNASDDGPGSGVNRFEYAIGTSPTSRNIRDWTPVGYTGAATATGLSLQEGATYYIQVRAVDELGQASTAGVSDGITVVPVVSTISQLWERPDIADAVAIRNKVVTHATGSAFWIEESDRTAGLKVVSSAEVSRGDLVSVAGILSRDGSIRAFFGDVVVVGDAGVVPRPLLMRNKNVGGSSFNSATPGITGAAGLYNIGLLVRTCGTVTYSDTSSPDSKFFYIDDGSGMSSGGHAGLKVNCGSVNPPSSGMVIVTGIATSEQIGGTVAPVVIARDAADILAL